MGRTEPGWATPARSTAVIGQWRPCWRGTDLRGEPFRAGAGAVATFGGRSVWTYWPRVGRGGFRMEELSCSILSKN